MYKKRKNFARLKEIFPIPNLLQVQLDSYRDFFQINVSTKQRKRIGLQEVFEDVFPIDSYDKRYKLEFISYSLGQPKYPIEECIRRSVSYASVLKVKLRLISPTEVKEQEVYFGDIPWMTENATFIINGDERVIVSQLQRSPGVSFESEEHPTGKSLYYARIIPYRGAWLEFKVDLSDTILAYVDRKRNFPATQILRILGLESEEAIRAAFEDPLPEAIVNTLKKDYTNSREDALLDFYRKMRPTEPVTLEAAETLFTRLFLDNRRYDLEKVGRFILNRKLGLNVPLSKRTLDKEIVIEVIKYLIGLKSGSGLTDDIDHLGNRRVKTVGELVQNQVRIGLARLERLVRERIAILGDVDNLSVHHLINSKLLSNQIRDFFGRSQLSQFMDQVNPLSELTHKRRLSALGPGGLSRERAGFEVRDIHSSHYGRICPIETPEGPNIGLISSLTTYSRVNTLGLIETPYRKVEDSKATRRIEYLTADIDENKVIAQSNAPLDKNNKFSEKLVACRYKGDFPKMEPKRIEYMDVSPLQLFSVATALIPFLEHDDANRALMGSNMQRQAVPLMIPDSPLVGTGMEKRVAVDSGAVVVAKNKGRVNSVDSEHITVGRQTTTLKKFIRSNANTCLRQRPIVQLGQHVEAGEVIADSMATHHGDLALGKNLFVAFMPWRGFNFEDAILISENVVKEDLYTSIHVERFELEARETRLGNEEITSDIPNVSEEARKNLDENGIVRVGAEVKPDDILVGKVTPKTESELSPEERLLRAIFGEKAGDVRDTSLNVSPGIEGVIVDVQVFARKERGRRSKESKKKELEKIRHIKDRYRKKIIHIEEERNRKLCRVLNVGKKKLAKLDLRQHQKARQITDIFEEQIKAFIIQQEQELEVVKRGDELPAGVLKRVVVYIAMKRRLSEGDKIAGRHGNKGVVAKILPEEDMPFTEDGRPVDIVLNPLGVPSRMNVGQILETHLGWAAEALGLKIYTPIFDGATEFEIKELLSKAGLPRDGKVTLFDGFTGKPFYQKITIGFIYMLKLIHLVDEKIHARSIGPYSLVTQQPLGGKAQFGGQRFGEMEVWALEAYGAAYTLQEVLTVKSDDVLGRTRIYEAIVKGEQQLKPGVPESFNVLVKELQGLGLDISVQKK